MVADSSLSRLLFGRVYDLLGTWALGRVAGPSQFVSLEVPSHAGSKKERGGKNSRLGDDCFETGILHFTPAGPLLYELLAYSKDGRPDMGPLFMNGPTTSIHGEPFGLPSPSFLQRFFDAR